MKWSSKYPPMPLWSFRNIEYFRTFSQTAQVWVESFLPPLQTSTTWHERKTPGEALRIFGPKNMELSVAILIKRQKGGDVGEEDVIWVMVGVYLASNPLIWQVRKMIFAFKGLVPEGTDIFRTDVVKLQIVPNMRKGRLEMLFKILLW